MDDELKWRTIIVAVMNRLPRVDPWDNTWVVEDRFRRHVENEVRKLWDLKWLPCRSGKGWIAGLRVSVDEKGNSVGAGWTVGPKPPSRRRPRYSIVTVRRGTWEI